MCILNQEQLMLHILQSLNLSKLAAISFPAFSNVAINKFSTLLLCCKGYKIYCQLFAVCLKQVFAFL